MANLGFKLAMAEQGVTLVETAVGDRYVLEVMRRDGFALGGEQSGHVLFTRHATTGDGTLTAVQLMARMAATGRPLADLAAVMNRLPQLLINVRVEDKGKADGSVELAAAVAAAERTARHAPAGCSCARAAPSRSSGSWSRPLTRSRARERGRVAGGRWSRACWAERHRRSHP